jgi:hypothetical protein
MNKEFFGKYNSSANLVSTIFFQAKSVLAERLYALSAVRARLRVLPSCAIATDGADHPIAFELNDGYGFMHLQYTYPEFRRLGLGSIIELRLAQENVK